MPVPSQHRQGARNRAPRLVRVAGPARGEEPKHRGRALWSVTHYSKVDGQFLLSLGEQQETPMQYPRVPEGPQHDRAVRGRGRTQRFPGQGGKGMDEWKQRVEQVFRGPAHAGARGEGEGRREQHVLFIAGPHDAGPRPGQAIVLAGERLLHIAAVDPRPLRGREH